jgi:UBX domain-containing protein 1
LDDPANAEFLRALAMGRTPRELINDSGDGKDGGNVVVGLIDKRKDDYVEVFQSFSGTGMSLGSSTTTSSSAVTSSTNAGIFTFAALRVEASSTTATTAVATTEATTSIAVRMLNGQRKVIQVRLNATIRELALQLVVVTDEIAGTNSIDDNTQFQLMTGFPPKPLDDETATIESANLKGAQVSMSKC